jgi:hypothetical protein
LYQNTIIEVDFNKTSYFKDPNISVMCLVVMSSDGEKGSLTHLEDSQDVNINDFVNELYKYHNGLAPICLSGGMRKQFITSVANSLKSSGFIVSFDPEHFGSGGYRKNTIFPEKVIVKTIPDEGNPRGIETSLSFPQQNGLS